MAEPVTIPKDKSSFPDYLDFFKLRELGLQHIQKLGSDIWTDYNLHDPGITILEVLCYAITDLGYRANFDIKDLLARSRESKNKTPEKLKDQPADDNFFSAATILGCNPLTVADFRRLLIDIPGVKNAWLEKSNGQEIKIGIDPVKKELYYIESKSNDPGKEQSITSNSENDKDNPNELKLNGLYDICIEIEPQLITDACGRKIISREDIIKKVYEVFHLHRNLCEDLREVVIFDEEGISLCCDIELKADANPEEVMLQICLKIEEFLSPALHFHTLQEMIEMGRTVEEIFEGRPMTVADAKFYDTGRSDLYDFTLIPGHGFIDNEELKKMEPRSRIHVSDIHHIIMDIEGVLAIHKLVLVNYINDLPHTKGEKWCLPLTKGYMPHISIKSSKVNFLKGPLWFSYDKNVVIQRFNEEKFAKSKARLEPYQLDLPVPDGVFRDLKDYTSIQHDFPLTYGIGSEGIADSPTVLRKAQAHQLKAYLLFYDQILANYLSQLAHVRDLFAMRRDDEVTRKDLNHTYFTQILEDVPGADELIRNFESCCTCCNKERLPEDYPSYLACISEYPEDYQVRRNRFLDHLLARFSESFTDYVMLMYKIQKDDRNEQDIINSKASFLEKYPEISRNRGKAFNILDRHVWDTGNMTGLEKRIAALLGIENDKRHTLSHGEIIEGAGGWYYEVNLPQNNGHPVLKSCNVFETYSSAESEYQSVTDYLDDEERYYILNYKIPELKGYSFAISDESGTVIARSIEHFTGMKMLEECVGNIIDLFASGKAAYKYPEEPDNFFYEVIDDKERVILVSANIYYTLQAAEDSQSVLQSVAKSGMNYSLQDSLVENAIGYGFVFLGEAIEHNVPEIIAQSVRRFETREECQKTLFSFLCMAKLKTIACQVEQENECFEYWLYDAENKNLIFKSYHGYKYSQEASIAYGNFLDLAAEEVNYSDIQKESLYGFAVHNYGDIHDIIAIHHFYYKTEQEKEDRKWAIIYYLDDKPVEPPLIGGTPGEFIIEIRDREGNILLNSPAAGTDLTYRTANQTSHACQKIYRRAGDWSQQYYKRIDDLQGDLPFGFQILDRDNSIIAEHPQRYKTGLERDLAIKVLLYGIMNQKASFRYIKDQDGYWLELWDMGHEILMRSAKAYPDRDSLVLCEKEVLALACARSSYQLTEKEGDDFPYSFQLLGKSKEVLIVHTRSYSTGKERDLALQSIIYYICSTEFNENIRGTSGTYSYSLMGRNGKMLLESADMFSDEAAARSAFREMLQIASEYNNYAKTPQGFRFEIRNAEQHVIARPPAEYKFVSENEREAAIALIMAYLRDDVVKYKIENTGGSFYSEITDNVNQLLLSGTTFSPSFEKAEKELEKLIDRQGSETPAGLASKPGHYVMHEDEKRVCRYSFYIRDNDGNRVAMHPRSYHTPEELYKAENDVLSCLSDWKKLKESIIIRHNYFEFKDRSNSVLLLIDQTYFIGAGHASFRHLASEAAHYFIERINEFYRIFLHDLQENVIARCPLRFQSKESASGFIDDIILFIGLNGLKYEFSQESIRYNIVNEAGELSLSIGGEFKNKADAAEGLKKAYRLSPLRDNFKKIPEEKSPESAKEEKDACFTYELRTGTLVVASCPVSYGSAAERDEALESLIIAMQADWIPSGIITETERYLYELKNFLGRILLTSRNILEFDSWEEAASDNTYGKYLPLALKPSGFSSLLRYETLDENHKRCLYSFYIADPDSNNGTILFSHPYEYTSQKTRDDVISSIIRLLSPRHYKTSVEGIACGFSFKMSFQIPFIQEEKAIRKHKHSKNNASKADVKSANAPDNINVTIDGAIRYPAEGKAWKAACLAAELMKGAEHYFIPEEEEAVIWLLKKEASAKTVATVFSTGGEPTAIRDAIISYLQNTESFVQPEFLYEDPGLFYQLKNQDNLLLRSNSDIKYPLIAEWEGTAFTNRRAAHEFIVRVAEYVKKVDPVNIAPEVNASGYRVSFMMDQVSCTLSNHKPSDIGEPDIWKELLLAYGKYPENYRITELTVSHSFSFSIIDGSISEDAYQKACDASDEISELAQNDKYYRYISSDEFCLHSFELVGDTGSVIASHNRLYHDIDERQKIVTTVKSFLNSEGMHMLEHILLRPRTRRLQPVYQFIIISEEGDKLLRGLIPDKALIASNNDPYYYFFKYVLPNISNNFETVTLCRDGGENSARQLRLIIDENITAVSDKIYYDGSWVYDADKIMLIKDKIITDLEDKKWPGDKEFIKNILSPYISSGRSKGELEGDKFLPVPYLCSCTEGSLSSELYDPYSFRLTIVIPYWPKRFDDPEFREFIEMTLRREAPAHIFPRICWLNTCQMTSFEKAYKRWLEILDPDNNHCDSTAARNALVEVMGQLRSKYPSAQLQDCGQRSTNKNFVILDYTRLG